MYRISKIFKPEIFQGKNKRKNYFEGWYFKLVDKTGESVFAVIPGISYGSSINERHAFIQIIDSTNYKTNYFEFPFSKFAYSEKQFRISIDNNIFDRNGLELDIHQNDFNISGTLQFNEINTFPKKIFSPGIMGPFSFIPFMECYHGIINIQHRISGSLMISDRNIDFNGGNGYIEKDWGKSFPEWWFWIQSNDFAEKNTAFMFSIAKIPWLNKSFTGFISFLGTNETFYRFATYTGAKIEKFEHKDGSIVIIVSDKDYTMTVKGNYRSSGILKAPQNGHMIRKISESISSDVEVRLEDRKGKLIYHGFGKNTGMEMVWNTET